LPTESADSLWRLHTCDLLLTVANSSSEIP
jgi:hypothetical protein